MPERRKKAGVCPERAARAFAEQKSLEGCVLLSHVRRRCAAIGGLWRPQPISIYSNLPRPASSPSPPPTRQICRVVGVALNAPKRLNLTLSPPRAAPVGAKSTDGHPPDFRKPDANSTISQSRYGRHQLPLNHDTTILRVESKNDSDSTIPHPIFSNHNSTTRKRVREAAAESSSSWNLGEYAVSIRSDFCSTASLPPHIRVLCKRSAI